MFPPPDDVAQVTVWASARTLLSMVIESACKAGALSDGWAVAAALGSARSASVHAEQLLYAMLGGERLQVDLEYLR